MSGGRFRRLEQTCEPLLFSCMHLNSFAEKGVEQICKWGGVKKEREEMETRFRHSPAIFFKLNHSLTLPHQSRISEWQTNIHRDTYASYLGHPSLLAYISVAENESIGRSQFKILQVKTIYILSFLHRERVL